MTSSVFSPVLNDIETRLTMVLLASCGLPVAHIDRCLLKNIAEKYQSGPVPSTVIKLGRLDFAVSVNVADSVVAHLAFQQMGKHVEWWLLRYETGDCEIEIAVNGNSEPWVAGDFPDELHLEVKEPYRGARAGI